MVCRCQIPHQRYARCQDQYPHISSRNSFMIFPDADSNPQQQQKSYYNSCLIKINITISQDSQNTSYSSSNRGTGRTLRYSPQCISPQIFSRYSRANCPFSHPHQNITRAPGKAASYQKLHSVFQITVSVQHQARDHGNSKGK